MEEQSTSFSYTKLEKIQNQIDDLQNQKEKMIHHLEQKLIQFLKSENAFSHDFEILVGGMSEVLDSLQTQNPSKELIQTHQNWKKGGAQILKKSTSKKEKIKKTKQKTD